ncbi:MAG: DUF308 domain-containing protein [Methanobacteriota archaeon]
MTSIMEHLYPLNQGVWEVTIPKGEIPLAIGSEWERSIINIPTPGTIASYRNGQYHLHETKTHYKVHLDRFDPRIHPVLHLVDDAPLLLMIAETFITIFSFTKDPAQYDAGEMIQKQADAWHHLILLGLLSIVIGFGFVFVPDIAFEDITGLIVPIGVFMVGILTILSRFVSSDLKEKNYTTMQGMSFIVISGVLFLIPPLLWSVFILILLGIWMFSSAAFLLSRVFRGRSGVPEGFASRCIIGITSLILGLLIFIIPAGIIRIFLLILGVLIFFFGVSGVVAGIRLRSRMTELPVLQQVTS